MDWLKAHSSLVDETFQSGFNYSIENVNSYATGEILEWWRCFCEENGIDSFNTDIQQIAQGNDDESGIEWTINYCILNEIVLDKKAISHMVAEYPLNDDILETYKQIYSYCLTYSIEFDMHNALINALCMDSMDLLNWITSVGINETVEFDEFDHFIDRQYDGDEGLEMFRWWLDFLERNGKKWVNTTDVIDTVAANGSVETLSWFYEMYLENRVEFSYSDKSTEYASYNGKLDILDWWYQLSKISDFKFLHNGCVFATRHDNDYFKVANWWLAYHIENPGKLDHVFSISYHTNYLQKLDWWLNVEATYGLKFIYTENTIDELSVTGNIEALDRWLDLHRTLGYPLLYSTDAMDYVANSKVLEWWVRANQTDGVELFYTRHAMEKARSIEVLNWWKNSAPEYGLELFYSSGSAIFDKLIMYGLDAIFYEWWMTSGLDIKIDKVELFNKIKTVHKRSLKIWAEKHLQPCD